MRYHYVWLAWSAAFLVPWGGLYLANPGHRRVMWYTSLATAAFGLTEPIFVPTYWNPPGLFDLAQRTGFDIESLIFCFAIGGIGCALYDTLTSREPAPVHTAETQRSRHGFHRLALLAPVFLFVPLYFVPWNPIYPALVCLLIGSIASVTCRPTLMRKTLIGGLLFFGLYAAFMLGLRWSFPSYIEQVWNLRALSGVLIVGVPLEELVFGLTFDARRELSDVLFSSSELHRRYYAVCHRRGYVETDRGEHRATLRDDTASIRASAADGRRHLADVPA